MTYNKDNQIRKYVKGYGFMIFAKNFGSKYGKKFLSKGISASKRIKDTTSKFYQSKYGKMLKNQESEFGKIAGKKVLTKSAEATGDLIGPKIADKITSLKVKDKSQKIIEEEEIIIPPQKRQQILNDLRLFKVYNIKMRYNKITNLLGKLDMDEIPKFTTAKWIEIFYQSNGTYNKNKDIRFKTNQLRNDLCDFNDAYIVVTGKITATNPGNDDNVYNRNVSFKNSAPFFNCTLRINSPLVEDAQDLDIVIPMYNVLYYSKNFKKTTGSFWNYYPDMPKSGHDNNAISRQRII